MNTDQTKTLITSVVNQVLEICEQESGFSLPSFMTTLNKEILKNLYLKHGVIAEVARKVGMNRTTVQMYKEKFLGE